MATSAPAFRFYIDWLNDGDFSDAYDDITATPGGNAMAADGFTVTYGRDQARALSPAQPGAAAFKLNNAARIYSPDNTASPLYGQLVPGRPVKITAAQDAVTYTLYRGFIDDFTVSPNRGDRTMSVSCLDALARFTQANPLSTPLLFSVRTGTAIGAILDQLGWPAAARDLDPGATTIRWWWEEGTDGMTALAKVISAEGPPAICYVDTAGNFVFRDRHHRLLRPASTASQATFTNGGVTESASVATYSQPMAYDTGWRDIVNTVTLPVDQRATAGYLQPVWQSDATIAILPGASVTVIAQASDPFTGASAPVAGTDFVQQSGTTTAALSRTSGQSAVITLTDSGAGSVISGLQLQAYPVSVTRTVQVNTTDPVSATAYGVRGLPSGVDLSWACAEDAAAVAAIYLARYAQRAPIVTIPVANLNPGRLAQQLARDLSDRIHITDSEAGVDADFFIEQISHATTGTGRVLTTTFGCEKAPLTAAAPFTFDDATRGKFDTGGTFGASGLDDPATVFVFDSATNGKFDTGVFAT